ncbi:MAG: EAL domain-containing protein, partial [Synechocystis sp.]|nr:EAL domain-containing protein [Synechocystis sp.]
AGITIAIDDFGTGYSSLSYLKQLPIDILKIDQSFIQGIPQDPDDVAIARAIVALGKSLELEIVAEGVETADHVAFLKLIGCDYAQGYFYSPPVPPANIASYYGGKPHQGDR